MLTLLDNHEVISYPKTRHKLTARASHPYAIRLVWKFFPLRKRTRSGLTRIDRHRLEQ